MMPPKLRPFLAVALFAAVGVGTARASGECIGDEWVAGEWVCEEEDGGLVVNSGGDGDAGNLVLAGGAGFSTNVPDVNGGCGHSLVFPGTNAAEAAVSTNGYDPLAESEKFTVMAWVRRDSAPGANLSARIFSDADSVSAGANGVEFRLSGAEGKLALRINGTEVESAVATVPATNGVWHHVAVAWDGTRPATNYATRNAHFYVDGVQRGSGNVLQTVVASNASPAVVGNASPSRLLSYVLAGNVDDVLVLPGWAPDPSGNGNTNEAIRCFMNWNDDIFPPTLAPPDDIERDAGPCLAPVALELGVPSVWDNCAVTNVANDAPAVFPLGTNVVVWTVHDAAGNSATAVQRVVVKPSNKADCDGDGWSDLEEMEAGTSPFDRWSAPGGAIARGVVINEVLYNPDGEDDEKEWVELYCSAPHPVSLEGLVLKGTVGSAPSNLTTLCTFGTNIIEAGRHLLVGGSNVVPTPDVVTNFLLVNRDGGSRDKTAGVFLAATNGTVVDAVLYGYPNSYGLRTNEFGWVDADHRPPYANRHGETIARRLCGLDTDSTDDWIASSNRTPHVAADWVDSDGDGLSDAEEITGGTEYLLADTDGDGLTDWEEQLVGTNPNDPDTDDDGVLDGVEVLEAGSDPSVRDFNGTTTEVWRADGSAYVRAVGAWEKLGTSACCVGPGGTVAYPMAVATGGVYALVVEGASYDPDAPPRRYALQLEVNGVPSGAAVLETSNAVPGTAHWMMPWVPGGATNEVAIRWRWREGAGGALRIASVRAEAWGGDDTDGNGVPQWQDFRKRQLLVTDGWPAESCVSPVRLEGHGLAAYEGLSAGSSHVPAEDWESPPVLHRGLWDGWWVEAWLSPTGATEVAVTGDGGNAAVTGTVAWTEFDLLHPPAPALDLLAGDAVRWNLHPDGGAGEGAVAVWQDGVPVWASETNGAWLAVFTNAGTFAVWGTWSNAAAGTVHSETVEVTVAEASFPDQPVVWTGQERTWRCPGIGTNVQVDFEAGVAAVRTDTATGAVFSLRMERTESRTAVARLGGTNGVPADSTRVHGFTTYSSTDFPREVWFLDGGAHREATLFLAEAAEALPDDMEVHVEAVGTGVFIEVDGNLSNAVTVASADWNGGSIVYWIAADSWSAICNSLWVEQAGERVGSR